MGIDMKRKIDPAAAQKKTDVAKHLAYVCPKE